MIESHSFDTAQQRGNKRIWIKWLRGVRLMEHITIYNGLISFQTRDANNVHMSKIKASKKIRSR